MTVRRHQLHTLPPNIPTDDIAEQRLAVLRELAIRLPALGTRHELGTVGKGGTLLRLCEGVNRPSVDYDCDTDKLWPKPDQARLLRQALRGLPDVTDSVVSNYASRGTSRRGCGARGPYAGAASPRRKYFRTVFRSRPVRRAISLIDRP